MEPITRFRGEFHFLSNMYVHAFTWKGIIIDSVENGYQASKTEDLLEETYILHHTTPKEAKKIGRQCELRPGWMEMRLTVMEDLLRAKFAVPELWFKLKATSGRELIEGNNWGDTYWGVCNGKGSNHLGKLLMKIRDE